MDVEPSPQWFWKDGNSWKVYDGQTITMLEQAYCSGSPTLVIKHGVFANSRTGHTVDFSTMTQRNNSTNFTRSIKREGGTVQQQNISHQPAVPKDNPNYQPGQLKPAAPPNDRMFTMKQEDLDKFLSKEYPDSPSPALAKQNLCKRLTSWKESQPQEHDCPICLCELDENVVVLSACPSHPFHRDCIVFCLKDNAQFLKCPCCGHIYGVRTGTMPKGSMNVSRSAARLEGHSDCGTITINYSFPDGVQGSEHPNPGQSYSGTSRTGYLPDNKQGNEVLKLLQLAWERRLTFTIGTSVTNGTSNTVVWNGIHHKTATSGGATSYGFPDETYLDRVKEELKDLGVV